MKIWRPSVGLVVVLGVVVLISAVGGWYFLVDEKAQELPSNPLYLDARLPIDERVANLLSYMTLQEKIGQMALVEKNSLLSLEDITRYHLGALLSGSGAKPEENTVQGWRDMIDAFQMEAQSSRLRIPLLYGSDGIHGHAHVEGATVFPHAIGLGATGNAELVEEIASITRDELRATGVNWNFAPNLDQPRDMRWGRVYEAFSDDTKLVSQMGVSYIRGLQADGDEGGVLGTLKHYIGLGSMGWGTSLNANYKIDQGVTEADETQLRSHYLPPFKEAIDAGALSVLVGLNVWGDAKMVLQKDLLDGLLKKELGFKGFVVSDWYGVHEGRSNIFWATVSSISAGVDMFMLPFDYKTFSWHVKLAYKLGLISEERINEAVGRILYAKFSLGLFDNSPAAASSEEIVGSPEHREVAREAVSQSMVLLKNNGVLPITNAVRRIHVAGSAADNIGVQMGAWSIEWQGTDGNWQPGATSILDGIREKAGKRITVEYEMSGTFDSESIADLGIAVVGEKPYAEGWGDKEYPALSEDDIKAIEELKKNSNHVVVVIVSGRPLFIEHEIDAFDALVAAWLPGSEGGGVADVLFGVQPFTGKLPLPWPLKSEQLPVTSQGEAKDGTPLLFPRGFGLH